MSCQPCGCDDTYRLKNLAETELYPHGWFCKQHRGRNSSIPTPASIQFTTSTSFGLSGSIGLGGAPTRISSLPADPAERKKHPIASGVFDYFPDALAAIARVSWQGNNQHNPDKPLHWDRSKSGDEADTMLRHFGERGTLDSDGLRHTAKMAWRALALLQKEIEQESK